MITINQLAHDLSLLMDGITDQVTYNTSETLNHNIDITIMNEKFYHEFGVLYEVHTDDGNTWQTTSYYAQSSLTIKIYAEICNDIAELINEYWNE